jgi:hypothetical protein
LAVVAIDEMRNEKDEQALRVDDNDREWEMCDGGRDKSSLLRYRR